VPHERDPEAKSPRLAFQHKNEKLINKLDRGGEVRILLIVFVSNPEKHMT